MTAFIASAFMGMVVSLLITYISGFVVASGGFASGDISRHWAGMSGDGLFVSRWAALVHVLKFCARVLKSHSDFFGTRKC